MDKPFKGRQVFKFKQEMRSDFLTAIRMGAGMEMAAAYVGISRPAVHKWLRNGKADREAGKETAQAAFHKEFEQAQAAFVLHNISGMNAAGAGDWKMYMEQLARRRPEDWAPKKVVASSAEDLTIAADAKDLDELTDEQLAKIEKMISKEEDEDDGL